MTNPLSKLLKQTQRAEKVHLNEQSRIGKGTMQWFLENDVKTHPIHNRNALEFMICSEGFEALERDIRQATSTIDLVCWGFDPAMELTRMSPTTDPAVDGYKTWPRGTPYGDLLAQKAAEGVKVRLLLWYDAVYGDVLNNPLTWAAKQLSTWTSVADRLKPAVSLGAGNAPDMPWVWQPMPAFADQWAAAPRMQVRHAQPTTADVRAAYAKAWWQAALSGAIANLEVRFRASDEQAVSELKSAYLPGVADWSEDTGLWLAATHHQKPVLIDYHPGQGANPAAKPNACGYIMGLNSVTDYWDTPEHRYNDPRREVAFGKGASWTKRWHLKPYRDYAMRVRGQALACINHNFVTAWDRAQTTHRSGPKPSLAAARAAVVPEPVGAHRAQVVRTQPEDKDATILKTYVQACSNACRYIYIENQYFQLVEWVQYIKELRQRTLDLLRQAGGSKDKLPPLHLMVIHPQAERSEMVPRTYDALAQMGQATSVRGYHRQVEQVQGGKPVTDNQGQRLQKDRISWDRDIPFGTVREDLRLELLRRSAEIHQSAVARELDRLNIRTFAAMLMSYDYDDEARHLQVNARDNQAQEAQAAQERSEYKAQHPDARTALAKDEIEGDYSPYKIRPQRYREIYIHSKLMIIDDCFITLGSANLNARSMVVDSEINIASAEHRLAQDARRRVWGNLAGTDLDGGDLGQLDDQFKRWVERMGNNAKERGAGRAGKPPENFSFIHTHVDPRDAPVVRLA